MRRNYFHLFQFLFLYLHGDLITTVLWLIFFVWVLYIYHFDESNK